MTSDRPPLIEPALASDLPAIVALLEAQRLPQADIERSVDTTVLAREDGRVVACAAVEDYGAAGLLRSVAVADARRNTGLGIRITEAALEVARARGMRTLYLLTETAAFRASDSAPCRATRWPSPCGSRWSSRAPAPRAPRPW
jgi:amino-acid N-acetyltransferase